MKLAAPISIYVRDHRAIVGLLAIPIGAQTEFSDDPEKLSSLLQATRDHLKDFRSLTLA